MGVSKYSEEFAEKAFIMSLHGKSISFMAKRFGVNAVTIYEWMRSRSEFDSAIRAGKRARIAKMVDIVESMISEHDSGMEL